jgi:hypothetical protein
MIYEGWLYAGVKHGIGRKIEIHSDHIQVSEGKYVLDSLIEGKITEYDILKKEKIAERIGRFEGDQMFGYISKFKKGGVLIEGFHTFFGTGFQKERHYNLTYLANFETKNGQPNLNSIWTRRYSKQSLEFSTLHQPVPRRLISDEFMES